MNIKVKPYLRSKDIALVSVVVVFAFLVAHFWARTWDDSAITLAFSRNLVKYGDIIPSQFSDRIEGYSTFLWMLINALFILLGFRENQVLPLAKLLTTIFTILNIFLFWQLLKEKIKNTSYQIIALLLFAINARTIAFALDGMETPLYALLVLLSFFLYLRKDKSVWEYIIFSLVSSLLILIRFEGALFLIPFVLETIHKEYKKFFKEPFLYFWMIVFIVYHVWHYSFFGEIFTNPILAKGHWPYRPEFISITGAISYYLFPFLKFVLDYFILFALLIIYIIQNKKFNDLGLQFKEWRIIFYIAIIGVFIMSITGGNWNSGSNLDVAQRLSYPALPFLLLILLRLIDGASLKIIPFQSLFVTIIISFGLLINIETIFSFINNLQVTVTVNQVRKISNVVTNVQMFLHRDIITYAGPDMGGLLLYEGDGKRVIDLGLLCNHEFAKHGYRNFDSYLFQIERPEIIETHSLWVMPFLNSEIFTEMYSPVKVITNVKDVILFLRNDIVSEIIERNEISDADVMNILGNDELLETILLRFDQYWILDLRDFKQ